MKHRILFVDDEPDLLGGLRNSLRRQRREWEMVFAEGGAQALAALEAGPFDVIVSDMRMPGMDGVALLSEVRRRWPDAARIILSGYSDQAEIMRALPVAHQFMSKPCEVEVLREVVWRAFALRDMLQDEGLRAVIGRIERIPALPRTYWELDKLSGDPDAGLMDMAAVVERDPALAAKVLQVVNSAFFGLAQRQTSVRQAVGYLGAERLKAVALTAEVTGGAKGAAEGFSPDAYQDHSILTARVARRIAGKDPAGALAFTVGLVHDIGQLLLATNMAEAYGAILAQAQRSGRALHLVERGELGTTHAEVGAYLLGLWGLPLAVVDAVARHHDGLLGPEDTVLGQVRIANAVAGAGAGARPPARPEDAAGFDAAGFRLSPFRDRLDPWWAAALEEMSEATGGARR